MEKRQRYAVGAGIAGGGAAGGLAGMAIGRKRAKDLLRKPSWWKRALPTIAPRPTRKILEDWATKLRRRWGYGGAASGAALAGAIAALATRSKKAKK